MSSLAHNVATSNIRFKYSFDCLLKLIKYGILLITLLFLWGCGSEGSTNNANGQKTRGAINIAFPSNPPTLDTHVNTTTVSTLVARNIIESFVTPDANYDVQPMLAEPFEEKDDGKTIVFHLREGLPFITERK